MSHLKRGDRVRVEFEATVRHADTFENATSLTLDEPAGITPLVPSKYLTLITSPATVGDTLNTVAQLESLPLGATIVEHFESNEPNPNLKTQHGFLQAGDTAVWFAGDIELPVRLVHLPDSAA